jgi:hypothetical protein
MTQDAISRDVIRDLLPVYLAGACSRDTRQLVEAYLKAHPDFAADLDERLTDVLPSGMNGQFDRMELKALIQAKRHLRARSIFMGSAIFFSLLPFSFKVVDGEFSWLLAGEPVALLFCGLMAAGFWVGYAVSQRKLKVTGLV